MSVRTSQPLFRLPRLIFVAALLCTVQLGARAQGIGAHRGDNTGGVAGGTRSIQGHVISPTGRLPESRIRVTVSSSNGGTQTVAAGEDGVFLINNLETGPYDLTIDAGKEFEPAHESVYIGGAQQTVNVPIYLRLRPESNPALAGVPKPAVELYVKAEEAARKNDNDKAASLLAEAIAQHPQFGLAHNELGLVYMREGKLDKALEEYKAAAQTLPDDPFVQLDYGTALTQKKDFPEAEKHLRASLKRLDKMAAAHLYLGITLIGLRNFEEAERELQQAAKLGGDQMGQAHRYLGGLYWGKKEYKRAADELETYLKLSPKAPDADQTRETIKKLRGMS
ncbi:MAG: tetratricopeptide repeat protein [Acidobacteria bacterium]|nr:tetratricopeptide repeat protein [Acidobacteriota bacterium]